MLLTQPNTLSTARGCSSAPSRRLEVNPRNPTFRMRNRDDACEIKEVWHLDEARAPIQYAEDDPVALVNAQRVTNGLRQRD